MATVIVERRFGEAVDAADAAALDSGAATAGATALVHAVDRAGLRSVTIFDTSDPEALAAALARAGGPAALVWTATTNRDDGVDAFAASVRRAGPGSHALVDKHFPEPIEIGVPANNFDPSDWCLNMHNVRYLHSHMMPDRRRLVCLYVAADVETVSRAYRLIPVELGGVLRATVLVR